MSAMTEQALNSKREGPPFRAFFVMAGLLMLGVEMFWVEAAVRTHASLFASPPGTVYLLPFLMFMPYWIGFFAVRKVRQRVRREGVSIQVVESLFLQVSSILMFTYLALIPAVSMLSDALYRLSK